MILSLQGCMAVGKTTAARYLQAHDPQLHVCFEDNAAVIAEVKHRELDKNCYADYLEIQRLFLQNEVRRWQEAQKYPCTVMDFGAEEIVFYTLHYPKSKGLDWIGVWRSSGGHWHRNWRRPKGVCRSTFCFWMRPTRRCGPAKRGILRAQGDSLNIAGTSFCH